ncbi:hypothetical protein IE81DRAFT_92816 [Ceraceosorus guamensis]|uniref:Uncharacterized protein n=1 Tax=Ceraceosorus guamensis TaxID=1522189 RepID=A0A316W0I1_9BASI|nr:hypothetical protein IE81DRAFT_92816 [Ceraceosorus guamensis]PWN43242.1 hypothetical protein IE81DRAFT_92816 [Ceraceosorus guamensis]
MSKSMLTNVVVVASVGPLARAWKDLFRPCMCPFLGQIRVQPPRYRSQHPCLPPAGELVLRSVLICDETPAHRLSSLILSSRLRKWRVCWVAMVCPLSSITHARCHSRFVEACNRQVSQQSSCRKQ